MARAFDTENEVAKSVQVCQEGPPYCGCGKPITISYYNDLGINTKLRRQLNFLKTGLSKMVP